MGIVDPTLRNGAVVPEIHETASRNIWALTAAQSLGGANSPIIISLGGLVGQQRAPDPRAATLPVSLLNLGLAVGTLPAAAVMRRFGRRTGYVVGATLGVAAGLIATTGIVQASFLVFCIGTFLAGFYTAYVQSYRFAVTDGLKGADRDRAISRVMVGGLYRGDHRPATGHLDARGTPRTLLRREFLKPGSSCRARDPDPAQPSTTAALCKQSFGDRRRADALGNSSLAPLPPGGRYRRRLLRAHDLRHDGRTDGDGRTWPLGRLGRARNPVACAIHVRAELCDRSADGALRQGAGCRSRTCSDRGIGACCARRVGHRAFLGRADPLGRRLEFRLHRRNGHGRRLPLPGRARQGSGRERLPGLWHGCLRIVLRRIALAQFRVDDGQLAGAAGCCLYPCSDRLAGGRFPEIQHTVPRAIIEQGGDFAGRGSDRSGLADACQPSMGCPQRGLRAPSRNLGKSRKHCGRANISPGPGTRLCAPAGKPPAVPQGRSSPMTRPSMFAPPSTAHSTNGPAMRVF